MKGYGVNLTGSGPVKVTNADLDVALGLVRRGRADGGHHSKRGRPGGKHPVAAAQVPDQPVAGQSNAPGGA